MFPLFHLMTRSDNQLHTSKSIRALEFPFDHFQLHGCNPPFNEFRHFFLYLLASDVPYTEMVCEKKKSKLVCLKLIRKPFLAFFLHSTCFPTLKCILAAHLNLGCCAHHPLGTKMIFFSSKYLSIRLPSSHRFSKSVH